MWRSIAAFAGLLLCGCASGVAPSRDGAATGGAPGPASAPSPVEVDDLYRLGYISEIVVSPGEESAWYLWTQAERGSDSFRSEIRRLDLEDPRSVQRSPFDDGGSLWNLRLSPDGRYLAWLDATEQTYRLRWSELRSGKAGRPHDALRVADELSGFEWSPDGDRFVVVRRDAAPRERRENAPHVITRTLIQKDGEGYTDDRHSHLWIVERDSGASARQITRGDWDDDGPAWAPDGRSIAFVSNRAPDPDLTDDTDIYLVPAAGGETELLFAGPGPESALSWSHRGDRLAFHALRRANDYYQPQRVMTISARGGTAVDLTGALDAWVASDAMSAGAAPAPPLWSADDERLTLLFERSGATWIGDVDSRSGETRELAGGRFVHGLVRTLPRRGALLYSRTDPVHPPELYRQEGTTGEPTRLTRLYDDWLRGRRLATPEKLTARNSQGDAVEAWLYPPLDPPAGGKAPLVLYIHGGPQGFDGDYFDFDLENQLFPARGWAVLRVNYRGSTSYGERFSRAIWGDWHSREYEDLMAALDHAIATHAWIDPGQLGIGGWSYGGIMTLWTVGHTDRFRVGVPERLAFDYLSSFGEDQWFVWYLSELGNPLEHEELYRRLSPGTYAAGIRTPLYLIANEEDRNCPLPQAMQLYQRLRLMGQQTELVIYPGEAHSMSSPAHLADRLRRLQGWYGRHLGP
ncbi:MAG: S9 family peptidase [Thermoanaerobaculia bacterium]